MSTEPARAQRDRELFDRIAGDYARKDLAPAASRARRARLLRSLDLVPEPYFPRLMEAGCGAGFAASYLDGRYGEYVGVDHSPALVATANARHGSQRCRFLTGDLLSLPELGGRLSPPFDLILMIGVLHHTEQPAEVLRSLVPLLRPGGWLVANEPQPANPLISAARGLRKRVDASYSDDQVEISAEALAAAFEASGLEQARLAGQGWFSTPFAEVVLPAQRWLAPLVGAVCRFDRQLERGLPRLSRRLCWNLVAVGRRL